MLVGRILGVGSCIAAAKAHCGLFARCRLDRGFFGKGGAGGGSKDYYSSSF